MNPQCEIVLERLLSEMVTIFLPMVREWRQLASANSDGRLPRNVGFCGRIDQIIREHPAPLARRPGAGN